MRLLEEKTVFITGSGGVLGSTYVRRMLAEGAKVVATDLPYARGIPIAVDCTVVSPLHADGSPWPNAHTRPGASFARAIT